MSLEAKGSEDRRQQGAAAAAAATGDGAVRTNLFTAMGNPDNSYTMYKLVFFSVLMAVAPLGVFFFMRDNYLPSIGVTQKADMISGVSAILCVQAVIALYVVMAFSESTEDLKRAADAGAPESKKSR